MQVHLIKPKADLHTILRREVRQYLILLVVERELVCSDHFCSAVGCQGAHAL